MRYAMIMAGGAGTRLWPMSRKSRPKQLLPFIHGRSLLELAAERLKGVVPQDNQYICTSEEYRAAIRTTLPQFDDEHIIGEPVGRDTLNAVGLTAAVLAERDPEAVFAVLTSDHLIEPVERLRDKLKAGIVAVEKNMKRFVTYSVPSKFAAEQFGWIKRGRPIRDSKGVYHCEFYHEKPKKPLAIKYHADKTVNWSSGMFVFPAAGFLEAVARHAPEAHPGLLKIGAAWNTSRRGAALKRIYKNQPKISVDHAIMVPLSKDKNVEFCTIPLDLKWVDVGSWTSYAGELPVPDKKADNCTNARFFQIDSTSISAVSDDPAHTIATIGCHDLIIVRTKDATLVCQWDDAQNVKKLAEMVDEKLR